MSEMKPVCPMCHSDQVAIERRPNGNCHCTKCRHMWPNKSSDAEAALKEKDARIKELETLLKEVIPFIGWDDIAGIDEMQTKVEKALEAEK